MEKDIFIEDIIKLLKKVPMEKKDEWILMKAKLLSESEQQDFIMSLTGEKKITYMPTETEIEEFCEKVNNGDIYVEYETHYCEFNSEGRYMDDWEVHHNDPQNAFPFLDRVFRGCHDLMREQILEEGVREINAALENISDGRRQWREEFALEKKKARKQHLLLDLQKKCRNRNNMLEKSMTASVLQASWKQISELLQTLRYERYIDDQLEIDEVWNICEALIKRDRFEEEDWGLRKRILEDMVSHKYYECYGCYDPIKDLSKKLYITEDEILAFADMLNEHEHYAREAADLYREHGRMEQYVRYLETHLYKSSKEYLELIECYCNNGNEAKARCVAQQGLENCKDDLTDLFIFLLKEAKKYGENEKYKKLYASAKRRKKADIVRINKSL